MKPFRPFLAITNNYLEEQWTNWTHEEMVARVRQLFPSAMVEGSQLNWLFYVGPSLSEGIIVGELLACRNGDNWLLRIQL